MHTAVFVPLALTLMCYCGYYWSAVTATIVQDARQERMKRHLDWTVARRRGLAKPRWRVW